MSADTPPAPFRELADFVIDEASVRLLPYRYALENLVVVLGRVEPTADTPVDVGVVDPHNQRLIHDVEHVLCRHVRPVAITDWEIARAIELGWGKTATTRGSLAPNLVPVATVGLVPRSVEQMVNDILGHAIVRRVSDVHIECYEHDVDVRFRVDGLLQHVGTPVTRGNIQQVISRLKVLAGLDITERRRAQDGVIAAMFTPTDGSTPRPVDFRISVVPGPFGEDAVLRLLDGGFRAPPLEALGLRDADLVAFRQIVASPEGLVLIVGPTGSGKTSTIYAVLEHLQGAAKKILTVEDPVELPLAKINQKQVSPVMGYADFTRAFMRQNPDVIFVGEVRDAEVAAVAARAAQTGHLVLSTLHAADTLGAVARLRALDVPDDVLAGCLSAVVAQRLVRVLCRACRTETPPTADEARALGLAPHASGFFTAPGCAACGGDGTHGRRGVFEVLAVDETIADLIADGAPLHDVRTHLQDAGMPTLGGQAMALARDGVIALAEVMRVIPWRMLKDLHGAPPAA